MAGQAFSHRHQEFIRFLNTVEAHLNILDGTVIGRNMQREPKASLQGRRRCVRPLTGSRAPSRSHRAAPIMRMIMTQANCNISTHPWLGLGVVRCS